MKLAGAATISDTAAEPVSINLTASGTIRGRLVDEDGEPIGNAKILPDYEAFNSDANAAVWPYQPGLVMNPTQIPVNKDGTFEIVGLVPSWKYSASAVAPQDSNGRMMERGIGYVFEDITVESGQTVDLGDVQPVPYEMRRSKPKEPAADKPTAQEQTTSASKNSESSDQVLIRGRVTGPDGKPAAGAHVAVVASSLRQQRGGDLGRGDEVLSGSTTDANGQFQLTLSGVSSKTHRYAALVARAEGSALAWQRLNLDDAAVEVSLELAAEGPIRGRLVDIEGRPAGGVRLHYRAVMPTSKDGKFEDGVGFRELDKPAAAWPQPITSDADGNFVLPGIAAGQGVWLAVEASDRFAPQDVSLNTGMPEQRGERDGTYRSQVVRNLKPGEEPVLALAPAQIFEGVVTYEDTGKPAPHARLTIWASQQKFGSMVSVPGKADAQGRYRISPSPGIRFGVTAYPPDGAPYLTRELPPVDWEDAATVKKVDVTLPRGVMVRGRVIDATTGRPVPDATVQYVPEEANNPNDADDILTGWQGIQLSNDEGEFEIVTLPGPGNLLIHGPAGEFILQESSSSQLSRGTPGGQRRYAHAFERIESQAGGEAIDLTIELQPAKKVAGRIVDESGAPIDEALMITRLHITPHSPFWRGFPVELLGGRFELGGLASGEQYPTHFLDPKRRLGATAGLKAEDSEPTVVLKPCGQATARFIDPEGQPLDGFSPTLEMIVAPGAHRYDLDAMKQGELAADTDYNANIDRTNYLSGRQTDNDGRVTFPALIPGATYRIGRFDDGKGVIVKDFSVGSGESLDLGDIVMRLEN
jgi:protocatechuate 3,4-dioxygenase beta subunit